MEQLWIRYQTTSMLSRLQQTLHLQQQSQQLHFLGFNQLGKVLQLLSQLLN